MSAILAHPTPITPISLATAEAMSTSPAADPAGTSAPPTAPSTPSTPSAPDLLTAPHPISQPPSPTLLDAFHALDYTDPASLFAFFHSLPPHLAAALDHLDSLDPDDPATQDADHALAQLLAQELYTSTSDKKSAASATPQPSHLAAVGAIPASPAGSPARTIIQKSATSATPASAQSTAKSAASATGGADIPVCPPAPSATPATARLGIHAPSPVLRPLMAESAKRADNAHTPHAPHLDRIPLRDQAFALHCQGLRAPAISQQLGVPQRTIRAWIAAIQDEIRADSLHTYTAQLTTALEGLRQLLAAAWASYDTDATLHQSLIAQAFPTTLPEKSAESATPLPLPSQGRGLGGEVRPPHIPCRPDAYLRVALNVQRQIIRLLGLDRAPAIDGRMYTSHTPQHQKSAKSAKSATPSLRKSAESATGGVDIPVCPPHTPHPKKPPTRQPALTHRQRRRAALPFPHSSGAGGAASALPFPRREGAGG